MSNLEADLTAAEARTDQAISDMQARLAASDAVNAAARQASADAIAALQAQLDASNNQAESAALQEAITHFGHVADVLATIDAAPVETPPVSDPAPVVTDPTPAPTDAPDTAVDTSTSADTSTVGEAEDIAAE